jgi:hypothetical protein
MNEFRLRRDGSLVTEMELRILADGTQLPEVIDRDACDFMECDPVLAAPRPEPGLRERVERAGAVQDDLGNWVQNWAVVQLTDEEIEDRRKAWIASQIRDYEAQLDAYFDEVAQRRRYYGRITCALRAGYAGPFHDEGVQFAQWMDNCNAQAYATMEQALAGEVAPTWDEFKAALPPPPW